MYEYYWMRAYVALINENQIKTDLEKRTVIFNTLGAEGWELIPLAGEPHHYCFRRDTDPTHRKCYEYQWIRNYIALTNEQDIRTGMERRTQLFNELSAQGWVFLAAEQSMYCFVRRRGE